jgi:hypothetical protein
VLTAPPAAPAAPAAPAGRPGAPGPAVGTAPARGTGSAGPTPAGHGTAAARPAVPGTASPAGLVPVTGPQATGIMPRWLKGTLLAVALLAATAFLTPPAVAISRGRGRGPRGHPAARGRARRAARTMARIVQADHERLIVTYSISDDTVYLLTPPGEDPRAVLRAARLVLPEDTYQHLAGHLGVPAGWQQE